MPAPEDIGIAMVLAPEDTISRGTRPEVGETVRFLPDAGGALRSGGTLGGIQGEDRWYRLECVVNSEHKIFSGRWFLYKYYKARERDVHRN